MFKKKTKNLVLALMIAGIFTGLAACSKKTVSDDAGMVKNDEAAAENPVTEEIEPADDNAAVNESPVGRDISFDFDSSAVSSEAAGILKKNAEILAAHKDVNATIEGHCDDRGTNEYNMALGDRRAQSAKAYLVDLGIAGDRLSTISYGEEKPVVPGASSEDEHAKNRRVHISTGDFGASVKSDSAESHPVDKSMPANSYHYSKIDGVSFVRQTEIESYGTIFNKRKSSDILISERDEVYIQPEEGRKMILGNQYIIFKPLEPLENKDKEIIGIPHQVNGVVEIVKIEQNHVVAKVIKSYREFEVGNKIGPYTKKSPDIKLAEAVHNIEGDIIKGTDNEVVFAQQNLVFIDKGKTHNLAPGQIYDIYWDLEVPPSNAQAESTKSPIDYGQLLIIDSGEQASTALIIKSEKTINPWEKFKTPK